MIWIISGALILCAIIIVLLAFACQAANDRDDFHR